MSKAANFLVSPGKRCLVYDIAQHHQILDFQIFLFFALFQEITTKITIHYKGKKKQQQIT